MAIDVVLGLQRGDEGKGRFVDLLAVDYDVVARFNGGPNAGHTIARDGQTPLRLHQVPSGITYPGIKNVIGNGSYVDPLKLLAEIAELKRAGVDVAPKNLSVSNDAHLILPHHISLDEVREAGRDGQGSTLSGIAFVARDKYERSGIRAEALLGDEAELRRVVTEKLNAAQAARKKASLPEQNVAQIAESWTTTALGLRPLIVDTFEVMRQALTNDQKVLAEGAQATWLDIEHGMYPFVTSSHTTTGGVLNGLGVGPTYIHRVVGVAKALRSHVGGGPFVTKETNSTKVALLRGKQGRLDSEYGATTGRERQVGYLDLPELRRAIWVNGVTELALTKVDVLPKLGKTIPVAVAYLYKGKRLAVAPTSAHQLADCRPVYERLPAWTEDISDVRDFQKLPAKAQDFVKFLERKLELPVTMIGVGPYRNQVIFR